MRLFFSTQRAMGIKQEVHGQICVFKRSLWQRMEWRGTDNTGGGKFSLLFQDLALHLGWKLHEGRDMTLSPNSRMIAGSLSTPRPVERPPTGPRIQAFQQKP